MKENIIGRQVECDLLGRIERSERAEFVAVCGRRRVGKTFLVREYFAEQMAFQTAGLANAPMREQLRWFHQTLCRYARKTFEPPKDWYDAFNLLIDYLDGLPAGRKVVFLDELPWMDTPKSSFISALEGFWNTWASARTDIILIVCGSATSWMLDKLIHNHGGLYGRLTHKIFLQPFTLGETRAFLKTRGFNLSHYEIAVCYMILGGIPHYLSLLDPRLSLTQNIDSLIFHPNGELYDEFSMLYAALFKNSEDYIKIVQALSEHPVGMTRQEIIEATKLTSGSQFTRILSNLAACGFIREYINYSTPSRELYYQLIDFFSLFYFRFLQKSSMYHIQHWNEIIRTPSFYSWAGLTYELLVLSHVEQVKRKLSIGGVISNQSAWRCRRATPAAQIDLLIDRRDNTINICEMKFSENEFVIDANYYKNLQNKLDAFIQENKSHKSLQLTMITTFGVKSNEYSGILQNEVLLDDLFDN